MVTPIDLEVSTKVLIGQHGQVAHAEAKKRAQELRDVGDKQGAATIEQIAKSIRRLQNISNDNEKGDK